MAHALHYSVAGHSTTTKMWQLYDHCTSQIIQTDGKELGNIFIYSTTVCLMLNPM
jgi:hypothetical protein